MPAGRVTIKTAMDYQSEIEQLKETLTLVANIQRRQAAVQRDQATWLEQLQQSRDEQEQNMKLHAERMAHIDMRLAEITDKLDGLIGFAGGFFKPPQ